MRVVSFYSFLNLSEPESFRDALQSQCEKREVLGTILVASEGFNGTIAGEQSAIEAVLAWIEKEFALDVPIDGRWTESAEAPFHRMRVRHKKEIVTLGCPDIRPHEKTGNHVQPEYWNALIDDPNSLVIDTRTHYEVVV